MKLPRLPKVDLIPGKNDGTVLALVALAFIYVGTGGWSERRWKEAVATAGPVVAWLVGYRRGFETFNPTLHVDELVKAAAPRAGDAVEQLVSDKIDNPTARRLVGPLAGDVADALVGRTLAELDPRGIFSPADDEPALLPPGWSRDEFGHLRDSHGRYASEEAARNWRPG